MFFNPFAHLSISELYPLAKLRRSTLWERFKDTFETIHGRIEVVGPSVCDYSLSVQWSKNGQLTLDFFEETINKDGTKNFSNPYHLNKSLNPSQAKALLGVDSYDSIKSAFEKSGELTQLWPTILNQIPSLRKYDASSRTESKVHKVYAEILGE